MKKTVSVLAAIVVLAIPAAASADNNASFCGATHGAFASENGNFGWLGGLGGIPGYHNGAVGQEPGATGFNNSNACGSPQA